MTARRLVHNVCPSSTQVPLFTTVPTTKHNSTVKKLILNAAIIRKTQCKKFKNSGGKKKKLTRFFSALKNVKYHLIRDVIDI